MEEFQSRIEEYRSKIDPYHAEHDCLWPLDYATNLIYKILTLFPGWIVESNFYPANSFRDKSIRDSNLKLPNNAKKIKVVSSSGYASEAIEINNFRGACPDRAKYIIYLPHGDWFMSSSVWENGINTNIGNETSFYNKYNHLMVEYPKSVFPVGTQEISRCVFAHIERLIEEQHIKPENIILNGYILGGAIASEVATLVSREYESRPALFVDRTFSNSLDLIHYYAKKYVQVYNVNWLNYLVQSSIFKYGVLYPSLLLADWYINTYDRFTGYNGRKLAISFANDPAISEASLYNAASEIEKKQAIIINLPGKFDDRCGLQNLYEMHERPNPELSLSNKTAYQAWERFLLDVN